MGASTDTDTATATARITLTVDVTPPGWKEYSLEDMVRAGVYLVRHFALRPDLGVKVVSVQVSAQGLNANITAPATSNLDEVNKIPETLRALAAIPLAPCPCGCGVDLSTAECYRDDMEVLKGSKRALSEEEKALAMSGRSIEAIRKIRQRLAIPLKDAADLVAAFREKAQKTWDNYAAQLPPEGSEAIKRPEDDSAFHAIRRALSQRATYGG